MGRSARSAEAKSTPQFPLEWALPQGLISLELTRADFDGGRGDRIRTCDLLVPNQALYQAKLHPEMGVTYHAPAQGACGILARRRTIFSHLRSHV